MSTTTTPGSPLIAHSLGNEHPALWRCWHPVARSEEVTDRPVRAVLLGQPWVLYRAAGRLVAFADRCPHRGAPLSLGRCEEATLRCAYHGWRFGPDGRCVEIPAIGPRATLPVRARLQPAWGVAERHGLVFLAPSEPITPLGTVAEADDAAFMCGPLPTISARASAGLLADNFLDMAHFPFVHAATFGAEEPVVPPYEVVPCSWGFTVSTEHPFANREDPGVAAGIRPLVQRRRVTYRYVAPFHLVLRLDFLDSGGSNVIGLFLQPETAGSCRMYSTLWRDDCAGDPAKMAEAVAFELSVLEEDLVVQQAYDELSLPLETSAELHTRADRSTLELRRVLARLVAAAASLDADR